VYSVEGKNGDLETIPAAMKQQQCLDIAASAKFS